MLKRGRVEQKFEQTQQVPPRKVLFWSAFTIFEQHYSS